MRKIRVNNSGFTLIELLVVIAVLAILVLIGMPRFLGQTEKAKIANIQNDVAVIEKVAADKMTLEDIWNTWPTSGAFEIVDGVPSSADISTALANDELYGKVGAINEPQEIDKYLKGSRVYKRVPSELVNDTRSKLDGTFYIDKNGNALYIKDGQSEEPGEHANLKSYLEATYDPIGISYNYTYESAAENENYGIPEGIDSEEFRDLIIEEIHTTAIGYIESLEEEFSLNLENVKLEADSEILNYYFDIYRKTESAMIAFSSHVENGNDNLKIVSTIGQDNYDSLYEIDEVEDDWRILYINIHYDEADTYFDIGNRVFYKYESLFYNYHEPNLVYATLDLGTLEINGVVYHKSAQVQLAPPPR